MSHKAQKIAIASDHAGFSLKQEVIKLLTHRNIPFEDLGCPNEEAVDYPDYAEAVASQVSQGRVSYGILVCGTGMGMCMAANKFSGVRAATVSYLGGAKMVRQHNNANVLCLGGRITKPNDALEIVKTFLETPFEGGRHERRVEKIEKIEKKNMK